MTKPSKAFFLKTSKTLGFFCLSLLGPVGLLACSSNSSQNQTLQSQNTSSQNKVTLSLRGAKSSQLAVEGLANKTLATKVNATERLNSLGLAKSQTSWSLQSLEERLKQADTLSHSSKLEALLNPEASFKSLNTGLVKLQRLTEELLLVESQLQQAAGLQKELDQIRERFVKAKDLLNQILSLRSRLAKAHRLLGLARLNLANAYEHN